jgi:hypothetical protein
MITTFGEFMPDPNPIIIPKVVIIPDVKPKLKPFKNDGFI